MPASRVACYHVQISETLEMKLTRTSATALTGRGGFQSRWPRLTLPSCWRLDGPSASPQTDDPLQKQQGHTSCFTQVRTKGQAVSNTLNHSPGHLAGLSVQTSTPDQTSGWQLVDMTLLFFPKCVALHMTGWWGVDGGSEVRASQVA